MKRDKITCQQCHMKFWVGGPIPRSDRRIMKGRCPEKGCGRTFYWAVGKSGSDEISSAGEWVDKPFEFTFMRQSFVYVPNGTRKPLKSNVTPVTGVTTPSLNLRGR